MLPLDVISSKGLRLQNLQEQVFKYYNPEINEFNENLWSLVFRLLCLNWPLPSKGNICSFISVQNLQVIPVTVFVRIQI